ncbi:MAG: hypothetical protein GX139_02750 [Armatimonadetes bacterium]|nr:hypothetical protein [Armatimonadota bacterium]
MRTLLPPGFIGLMFAAILPAQMSSLSAFMVAASALLSRNIYKKHFRPGANDLQLLGVARWAGFVIVVLGVVFALTQKGVAEALMWFWTLSTFTGVFMWAGELGRKANATGAWASYAIMFIIWFVVGEPGQLVSQNMAVKHYQAVSNPGELRAVLDRQPVSRVLLDVVHKTDKGVERRNKVALIAKRGHGPLISVREATGSDKSAMNISEAGGVVVESADSHIDVKPGDIIMRSSPLPLPGIYADKSLLHYRLMAFLPAGILALILGSLLGRPMSKDKLDNCYKLITTPVGKEGELEEQGVDMVYAGESEGHPWEINHPRAVNIVGFAIAFVISLLFVVLLWWVGRIGA